MTKRLQYLKETNRFGGGGIEKVRNNIIKSDWNSCCRREKLGKMSTTFTLCLVEKVLQGQTTAKLVSIRKNQISSHRNFKQNIKIREQKRLLNVVQKSKCLRKEIL